jgi:anaerobic ribonucleoside-triphosphate reductase
MAAMGKVDSTGLVGSGVKFERIRRITGYLVGTLDRFNNGKAAEERDRVKHLKMEEWK